MPLYDYLAPAYDPVFEKIYRPFRERALEKLTTSSGASVLDLACGSGQNFPLLARLIGAQGYLIGLDISRRMLRFARQRSLPDGPRISLIQADSAHLTPSMLQAKTGVDLVDFVLCTYGFTSMRDPEAAFRASWNVLKPGGGYLINDIHASPRTLHARAVEWATRSRFNEEAWRPLREVASDFRMDYLDPSAPSFWRQSLRGVGHEAPGCHSISMSIVINKDGLQLGPYSLEQARTLVLEGTIDADDWAWPDGATEWVQLRNVPGFTAAKAPPAKPAAPAQPLTAVSAAEEEDLWRGHPSQILNLHVYLFWAIILAATLVLALIFADNHYWALGIFGVVAIVALAQSAWAYFHLRLIEYIITTQRVRVISGLFSKEVSEIELFRVKDTSARQAFFQRLFGLGTITVLSGDEKQPRLVLDGVPNALEMRERLRQEVMSLRQRFGVRELDVM